MKKTHIVVFTLILVFAACNKSVDTDLSLGNQIENQENKEEDKLVSISEEQAKMIGLTLGKIEYKSLGGNIRVTGRLELFPQNKARVSPFMGGNVKAIYVIEGDQVKKGQTLAILEHPDFIQIQQDLQQKLSQFDYLKHEFERKKKLYEEEITSGKEFQKAKAEYFSSQSEINGLKSRLDLLGFDVEKVLSGKIFSEVSITSPINGFIQEIFINIGDFVEPQRTMLEIADNSRIHVDMRVYEKDIHNVYKGQKVYFTVANKPDKLLDARIHSVGKNFEDDSKSIHIHAHIDNPNRELLPGMYVHGGIVVDETPLSTVPEDAIVTEGEHAFLFIQTSQQGSEKETDAFESESEKNPKSKLVFEKVPVLTGIRELGYTEIKLITPLPNDALIVVKGAYMLFSEIMKGEFGDED